MVPYLTEAENLNAINTDMCSDVAGPSSSSSGDCFLSFQIGQILRTFTISPAASTSCRQLGFERDCNYHTSFWAYDVIMHKVY